MSQWSDDQLVKFDGVAARADTFRWQLEDASGNVLGELHPDRDRPPTLSCDVTRVMARTVDGVHLSPAETADVNTLSDRVAPYMILENGTEYRLGTFLFVDDPRNVRTFGSWMDNAKLGDFGLLLDQETPRSWSWFSGSGVDTSSTIWYFVTQAGLSGDRITGPGVAWDANVTIPIGTHWIQPIRDALTVEGSVGYVDVDGYFINPPAPDPGTDPPAFTYNAGGNVIDGTIVTSDELLNAPNRFILIAPVQGAAAAVGTYDLPDSAPNSALNIGRVIPAVVQVPSLPTSNPDVAAEAYAKQAVQGRGWVTFSTPLEPGHNPYDVVAFEGDPYIETAWSMQLVAGGVMTHTLRRHYE